MFIQAGIRADAVLLYDFSAVSYRCAQQFFQSAEAILEVLLDNTC